MRVTMNRYAYPSDLTDAQWELLDPLIPRPSLEGGATGLLTSRISSIGPLDPSTILGRQAAHL